MPGDAADGASELVEMPPHASPAQAKAHRIDSVDRILANWTSLLPVCEDAVALSFRPTEVKGDLCGPNYSPACQVPSRRRLV